MKLPCWIVLVKPVSAVWDNPMAFIAIEFVKLSRVCLVTRVGWLAGGPLPAEWGCPVSVTKVKVLNLPFDFCLSERYTKE